MKLTINEAEIIRIGAHGVAGELMHWAVDVDDPHTCTHRFMVETHSLSSCIQQVTDQLRELRSTRPSTEPDKGLIVSRVLTQSGYRDVSTVVHNFNPVHHQFVLMHRSDAQNVRNAGLALEPTPDAMNKTTASAPLTLFDRLPEPDDFDQTAQLSEAELTQTIDKSLMDKG